MPSNNNKGRGGKGDKSSSQKLIQSLKEACPPHKQSEVAGLVKQLNGDEDKIRQQIMEWWEDAPAFEEEWEDVNRHAKKESSAKKPGASGRGRGGRGRGAGRGREGRGDRGDRGAEKKKAPKPAAPVKSTPKQDPKLPHDPQLAAVAAAGAAALPKAPQGAWGKPVPPPIAPAPAPQPTSAPEPPIVPVSDSISSKPAAATAAGGNVWATKGSAHLIKAVKPVPPPKPTAPKEKKERKHKTQKERRPTPPDPVIEAPAPAPAQRAVQPQAPLAQPSWSQISKPSAAAPEPPTPVVEPPAPPTAQPPATSNPLNMGRWDTTGETDEMDFGFGAFQAEAPTSAEAPASPSRPPPGLMPPMPANAVLVHELENKLETTVLEPAPASPVQQPYAAPPQQPYASGYAAPGFGAAPKQPEVAPSSGNGSINSNDNAAPPPGMQPVMYGNAHAMYYGQHPVGYGYGGYGFTGYPGYAPQQHYADEGGRNVRAARNQPYEAYGGGYGYGGGAYDPYMQQQQGGFGRGGKGNRGGGFPPQQQPQGGLGLDPQQQPQQQPPPQHPGGWNAQPPRNGPWNGGWQGGAK